MIQGLYLLSISSKSVESIGILQAALIVLVVGILAALLVIIEAPRLFPDEDREKIKRQLRSLNLLHQAIKPSKIRACMSFDAKMGIPRYDTELFREIVGKIS